MSGHSHFSTIKRKKEATDKQRGQIFSKLSKMISVAAKQGTDPAMNPGLRMAIEEARSLNMPKENIERAIQKGSGELMGENLQEVLFEMLGPGGIAIIAEGITDNKNRTLGEVKKILNEKNGKLTGEGAVKWMFEKKGFIEINIKENNLSAKKDELELLAIEAGAEDISQEDDIFIVYTSVANLEKIKKYLEEKKIIIESAFLTWKAKEEIEVDEKANESCQKLFETLDNNEDIQKIYSNLKHL